jgi:hypothetical protein
MRNESRGLLEEKLPSGEIRYRVRVSGRPNKRITLSVSPDHFDFKRQYYDARMGVPFQSNTVARLRETGALKKHINQLLTGAKTRAREKGFVFSLQYGHVIGMLERQRCRCALPDIEFDLRPNPSNARRPFAVSIDRVNNAAGYEAENVRSVCTIVNIARSDWDDEDFIQMCKSVSANTI